MRVVIVFFVLLASATAGAQTECASPHPELSPQVCAPTMATEAELCDWALTQVDADRADECELERRRDDGLLELRTDATRFLWLVEAREGLRPVALLGEVPDPGLPHSSGRIALVRRLDNHRDRLRIVAFETEQEVFDEDRQSGARQAIRERHLTLCVDDGALRCELRVPLAYRESATGDPEPTHAEAIAVVRHDGRLRLTLRHGDWRALFGLGDLFGDRLSVTLPLRAADAANEELDPDSLLVQLATR